MYRLTNISDDPWTMGKFGGSPAAVEAFLGRTGLDGLELIRWGGAEEALPEVKIVGRHLSFWPTWLDFWRGDRAELLRQFGGEQQIKQYYRAATMEEFIENYRRELEDAETLGARYVVFHVSHVELEHSFNYRFTYSDSEIAEAFAGFVNRVLNGKRYGFEVLMENHWFPGLTFLDNGVARLLLDGVNADKKGLVLDIGHLMNTNTALESEPDAVRYIMDTLEKLDEPVRRAIRAIHLNSSLTGQYVRAAVGNVPPAPAGGYRERLLQAMEHVGRIDRHKPFLHRSIGAVVECVRPEYLVYELAADTLEELEGYVMAQNGALGFEPSGVL